MWEHNSDSNIWSYVVNGNIVADVVGVDEGLEANIYDEEDRLLDYRIFSFLSEAKDFVEKTLAGEREIDSDDATGNFIHTSRRNSILRNRERGEDEAWRAGERMSPQTKKFRNASKRMVRKIQQGKIDADNAYDVVIGESNRY